MTRTEAIAFLDSLGVGYLTADLVVKLREATAVLAPARRLDVVDLPDAS